jgi:lysophospholipase L1-like esterase
LPNHSSKRGDATCNTNAHGLRDHAIPEHKPDGEFRILSLGDSTALGFGVAEADTYATRLESSLRERTDRRVEVINAGVPGYASTQLLLYLENRGLAFDPDAVIIETNFNDRRAVPPTAEPDSESQFRRMYRQLRIRELLDHSMTARVMRALLRGSAPGGVLNTGNFAFDEIEVASQVRVSLEQYELNMREMIRLARNHGADIYLIGLPDAPMLTAPTRNAIRYVAERRWKLAERELERIENPAHDLIRQGLRNQIYVATDRPERVRQKIPVRFEVPWISTDGYLPIYLGDSYIAVLERLGDELDIPVVIPKSSGPQIYIDYIHLNRQGHKIVAQELANAIPKTASFRGTTGRTQQ